MSDGRFLRVRRGLAVLLIPFALVVVTASWIWWAEGHPHEERRLRVLVHDQLEHWFPEAMAPLDGWHGLIPRVVGVAQGDSTARPRVLLVHGLDEPGSIWDDLVLELGSAGFEVWELRYPNDQGIDRSTDLLAELWSGIPADRPVVLVGHSMGGLVIRDFVTRWRHPVDTAAKVEGATVRGVILVGTPNQGSEWARLRVWLELRDHFAAGPERRLSLFAGLRDGTGEAKIDLRPGSAFLLELNARPWPESVPIRLIGGLLTEPPESMVASLEAISGDIESAELAEALHDWWSSLGEGLGDGVVPLDSLEIPGAPSPVLVRASHRGMLARLLPGDPEPAAIPYIIAILEEWMDP
jgi:pimeloyl-ACP methyl ester carboxylesterase